MKYFLLVCLFLAANLAVLGQEKVLNGFVINEQTLEPIPQAIIHLSGSDKQTYTDTRGWFSIQPGSLTDSVSVTHIGYLPEKFAVNGSGMRIFLQPAFNPLNEVVVSASREEQSRKDVPAAIGRVNSETIQQTHATALYQLLNKVSGVYMVNLGNEQHTMAIRQPITYNALYLYLEDGLPIRPTGIFNHNALYEINMNEVKNIEVIKGPSSSLYGSNAIGGAINFISRKPPLGQSATISLQGDNYNYYRADASGGFTSGKLGVFVGGYASHQENSWQDYAGFDKRSATLKTTYDFNAGTRLTLTGSYNYLNTQTPGSLDSLHFYDRSYSSNQRFTYRKVNALRVSSRIDHTWSKQDASFFTLFFRDNSTGQLPGYYIQDIRDQAGQYLKSAGQLNNQSFKSYGFLLQHRHNFSFLNSQLVGGIYLDDSPSSFYADFLDIDKDVADNYYTGYTNRDSLIDNYRIKLFNTAAYVQYQMNPAEPLQIVAGLRYDRVTYDFNNELPVGKTKYKQQEKNRFNVLAPKLGATYDLGEGKGIYTNFSIGFQPPETSSLYSSRQLAALKQATFYNYELGGWIPLFNRKLNAELSLYDMEGRNEIISVRMPDNTTQNQNAGATRHLGIEYNLTYRPSEVWELRFGGTNARHTYVRYSEVQANQIINYDGNRMTNAPSWIANTELNWKPAFIAGFRTALEWQHIGKYYINTANSNTYAGYDLFNLRTSYNFKSAFAKGAAIWLNILNLTNELYATTVTGNQYGDTYTAASPQTFSLGISYTFSKH